MPSNTQAKPSTGTPTLNALFISLDKNLLREKQGDALKRHLRYSRYFNKLNIIVFTRIKDGYTQPRRTGNLSVYPTNSASRWHYAIDAYNLAGKINQNEKLDLVSTQDPLITAVAGILVKLRLGVPLNIQIHNDFSSPFWISESLQNRILSLLIPVTLRFADSVRAVSRRASRIVSDKSKLFVVPVSVDLNFFSPKRVKKQFDLITVGRMVKQKNIPLLLDVVKILKNDFPKIKVAIIGDGPEEERLRGVVKELGLRQNVRLYGQQTRKAVRSLLRKSKIFVLPSRYEGLPLAAVEASACGLPVVMTNTSGAHEIVQDGASGYIVPINNMANLRDKLQDLMKKPKLRSKRGHTGRNWVERHFQRETAEQQWIEDLLRKTKKMSKVCFILPEICPDSASHYPYTVKLFNEFAQEQPSALFIERGKAIDAGHKFEKIILQKISVKPFNLVERFILFLRLRIEGYSIFYIHYSYWSLFILKAISLFLPTKIFYWNAEEFKKEDLRMMSVIERTLLQMSIRITPVLVTAGERLKKAYAETFGIPRTKIKVVPNWVEVKTQRVNKQSLRKKLSISQKKKIILFVHRLSTRKGAHLLPQIVDKVQKKVRNIHFVIIGSGPLEESLRSAMYGKPVSLLGDIPQRNIREHFAISDLFVMPSLREGFPRVILEAMTAGLPIVASDVGEISSILPTGQEKYLVVRGNVEELAEKISVLINNKELRDELRKKNQAEIKKYSLKNSQQNLLEVLHSTK